MITNEHTRIRTTEPDDAPAFAAIYAETLPRAATLDARREPIRPSPAEVRDMLGRPEAKQNPLYTLEDHEGVIRGFVGIRGVHPEASFAEAAILLGDPDDYAGPIATEAAHFIDDRAFARMHLRKVLTHGLTEETALRAFYLAHGYSSCGVQRQVIYTAGRWHDLETFTRLAPGI